MPTIPSHPMAYVKWSRLWRNRLRAAYAVHGIDGPYQADLDDAALTNVRAMKARITRELCTPANVWLFKLTNEIAPPPIVIAVKEYGPLALESVYRMGGHTAVMGMMRALPKPHPKWFEHLLTTDVDPSSIAQLVDILRTR